jgi:hypothetical protein
VQGQIIDSDVVVKPGRIPDFYIHAPWQYIPRFVRQYGEHYLYRYVDGRQAQAADVPEILRTMELVWDVYQHGRLTMAEKLRYSEYVAGRTESLGVPAIKVVRDALNVIQAAELPRARLVHADLTLENIVIEPTGNVVLIDPGYPREMVTPALDRGKLLQSVVMRWEDRDFQPGYPRLKAPWLQPETWPDWANVTDWAFLVTHWVRLLPHWPGLDIVSGFAVLEELKP